MATNQIQIQVQIQVQIQIQIAHDSKNPMVHT